MPLGWGLPPPDHIQWELEIPSALDPPKGHPEKFRFVVGLMGSYDCVHTIVVSLFVSLSLYFVILGLAAQEIWV
jgi:hypothetical protein